MRRLIPFLGVVLALTLSSAAGADTFRVARPHAAHHAGHVGFAQGTSVIPFTEAQTGPMSFAALRGIWGAAGTRYGIPWEVLAAINKVETNFGQNLGPSSAGAVGWMQFMPSTWARWGIDANGDGVADPDNPTDAIFSAARYLAGCGGQFDISKAVYCYNHSQRYVSDVLGLAAVYRRGGGGNDGGTGVFSVDLRPQIDSARNQISASKTELVTAQAQAEKLARAERRFLRLATTARVLSDQLEARRHAVLLGVRRSAAEGRVTRLRKLLDAAHTRLGTLQDQARAPFAPAFPAVGAPSGSDSGVVSIALQYLGVPYLWGGATPRGFDCSGLVQYVFAQLGISLPHYTVAQWHDRAAVSVPRDQLQPGDLVFFNGLDHVGIYMGNGYFIDAPHTGAFVRIDNLSEGWYAAKYDGAKRVLGGAVGGAPQSDGVMTFTTGSGAGLASNIVYFTH